MSAGPVPRSRGVGNAGISDWSWPRPAFQTVPPLHHAAELALEIRTGLLGRGRAAMPLRTFEQVCAAGGFQVREARLLPEAGGKQALLIPRPNDSFDICVDPTPKRGWRGLTPVVQRSLHRHRSRFLIGHEIAHSFFFIRDGKAPRRRHSAGRAEEDFCDEFARWLLVPWTAAKNAPTEAGTVLALQRRFDVSLELAARAFSAAAGPDVSVVVGLLGEHDTIAPQWFGNSDSKRALHLLRSAPARQALAEGAAKGLVGGRAGFKVDAEFQRDRRQMVLVAKRSTPA
jgi:hypothetical protein